MHSEMLLAQTGPATHGMRWQTVGPPPPPASLRINSLSTTPGLRVLIDKGAGSPRPWGMRDIRMGLHISAGHRRGRAHPIGHACHTSAFPCSPTPDEGQCRSIKSLHVGCLGEGLQRRCSRRIAHTSTWPGSWGMMEGCATRLAQGLSPRPNSRRGPGALYHRWMGGVDGGCSKDL